MERLRKLRNERNMTGKEVADMLGIDRTTYVKYENGKSEPSSEMLIALAKFFDVSVDYLLENGDSGKEAAVFGDILRSLRKSRNMTQGDLAAAIGVEQSSISKYEGKAQVIPSNDVKKKIAELFGVSIDYLLGMESQDKPAQQPEWFSPRELETIAKYRRLTPYAQSLVDDYVDSILSRPEMRNEEKDSAAV